MSYQLSEINRRIRTDAAGFLEECDQWYARKVDTAAQRILENRAKSPIVLLSGPSGSGKTTTAMKIAQALMDRGVRTHAVSMDNYFKTINRAKAPRTEDGDIDFESPYMLDLELLEDHFQALERGEEVMVPKFDFSRQMRNDSRATPLSLGKDEVVIFEGIHALNTMITSCHPHAMSLYISARSNIMEGEKLRFKGTWMRLTRRAVRDYSFRGTEVAETLDMWANVRRGEKLYISPFKNQAKIMLDSSLPYEVSVMKNYARPLLEAVPAENQRRNELLDLIAAFDAFEAVNPDLVPRDSLLREFIGGGSYHY